MTGKNENKMISLKDYRLYWEEMVEDMESVGGAQPITIDKEMTRSISRLPVGSIRLFWLPPAAKSEDGGDSGNEGNSCILFVMMKYDPQREGSAGCLERTQPVAEEIKRRLISDSRSPCFRLGRDLSNIDTLPETEFYGTLAGWSIGFRIKTDNLWPTD